METESMRTLSQKERKLRGNEEIIEEVLREKKRELLNFRLHSSKNQKCLLFKMYHRKLIILQIFFCKWPESLTRSSVKEWNFINRGHRVLTKLKLVT